jgi:hypothetical protein
MSVDDFFKGIEQVEMSLDSGSARFPIFYKSARMFTVMLPANWLKLRALLPDPRFMPAQIVPGVGAIGLTAFEYYDTDIGPYNEFSISIALNAPYYAPIPGYNILRQYADRTFNIFIHRLPVTTEIALRGGIDYYNFPKFLAGIKFDDVAGRITCDLTRGEDRLLTMSGAKPATDDQGQVKFLISLYHNRQPQHTEFNLRVPQGVIKWMPDMVNWSFNPATNVGNELCQSVLGNRALLYMYFPEMKAILYGPEDFSLPLLRRTILTSGFMPEKTPSRPAAAKAPARKAAKKAATKARKASKKPGGKAG